ncbi:hypothetical protein KSP39_PZI017478 [Platanthera zijinensis]|uniref:Uncharacterized protein n=1 Tax=Platanthera zijinensis TaxID=2320716 RepID=A0AAP0G037_9ASPA
MSCKNIDYWLVLLFQVPKESFLFIIPAFGVVSWEGDGSLSRKLMKTSPISLFFSLVVATSPVLLSDVHDSLTGALPQLSCALGWFFSSAAVSSRGLLFGVYDSLASALPDLSRWCSP